MKKLIVLIIVVTAAAIGFYLFYQEGSLPVDRNSKDSKIFVVNAGEGLNSITRRLEDEDLIRSRIVFYLTVKQLGIEKKIQAGDFRLSKSMDTKKIAEELTHGTLDNWVLFKEGERKEEYAQEIASQFNIPESEFNAVAKEGYLFPDTYLIPKKATAQFIASYLENTFDAKYTPEFQAKAAKLGLTKDQVVTLASLVEREARTLESKRQVADILLKRLSIDMPLQLDSTIQYILGYDPRTKTWWRENVAGFTDVDNPYNTYTHTGLPPGPICNPGLDSIRAVVEGDPNATKYLFFLVGDDNKMHYAVTHEEHEQNIKKYLINQ